jgi:hypothetical protein
MAFNQFDKITCNANMMELIELESLIEQTESSLYKFTISDNIDTSKISKILFSNLRKIHNDLSNRIIERVTGNDENTLYSTSITSITSVTSFDERQFITQTYNIPTKTYKYTLLKETSLENYKKMLQEMSELEENYNKNPNEILHQKIKTLQTKITRQKKRILSINNKN